MITCGIRETVGQHDSDEAINSNESWISSLGSWWNVVVGIVLSWPKWCFKNRPMHRLLVVWLKRVLCNVVCALSGLATVKVLGGNSTLSWRHTKWVEHGDVRASDCSHITRVLYVVWMGVCVAQTFSFTEKQLYNITLFNQSTCYQRAVQIMVYGIRSLGEV